MRLKRGVYAFYPDLSGLSSSDTILAPLEIKQEDYQ